LEVLHLHKLEQQRKAPKYDEALTPACYNDSQHSYPSKYTISTLMVVYLWRTRKRILLHLCKKEAREPSSIA
jgi:hypothetical protein